MAIDQLRLEAHMQDYENTTGKRIEQFVCPITLRECIESELIEGHVLNEALRKASRRTVIQYAQVDGFFGTRVEPDMVRFLNAIEDAMQITKHDRPTCIRFADESEVRAFPVNPKAGRNVDSRFTLLHVPGEAGRIHLFAEAAPDDPRWQGHWQMGVERQLFPPHWAAAMLKAGYLCLFDMLGYRCVFSPFGNAVRHTLAKYYNDRGTRDQASSYFREFQNAAKILITRNHDSDSQARWNPLRFDSLSDREVFLHYSDSETLFAVTCLFNVNEVTTSVTMPESVDGADAAVVWDLFSRYMDNPVGFPQRIHRARLIEDRWNVERRPTGVQFLDKPPKP